MPTFATVKHSFEAAHRVPAADRDEPEAQIHGHTFNVEWTFMVDAADAGEFDRADAEHVLRHFIDWNLDHGFLVSVHDEQMLYVLRGHSQKHIAIDPAPTLEGIAAFLLANARGADLGACVQVKVSAGDAEALVVI